ncbi:MAG: 23S rRNA (pseudouridine(1915)-N(3))-methyltransferase RlmH [Patescibacteria group bacterium]|nr:23S rRNA (pseudouridine(1915)-N(3))-methyltransferase RlmH [Patescibacteria group bacterium]
MKTHIQVRAVGKPQESWGKEAAQMYLARSAAFGKFEVLEAAEGHQGSAKPDVRKAQRREAESLLKNLPEDAYLIALDEHGKQFTSEEFSSVLVREADLGRPIVFFIGGSWGLDEELLSKANLKLSFGKMTLPHSLARVVLLEQIYRALMISEGRMYHK